MNKRRKVAAPGSSCTFSSDTYDLPSYPTRDPTTTPTTFTTTDADDDDDESDFKATEISSDQLVRMSIDRNSVEALHIFHEMNHPSVYKTYRANREGYGVFGFFAQYCNPIGRPLLKLWFENPIQDRNVLEYRHGVVEYFCSAGSAQRTDMRSILKKVTRMRCLLHRMRIQQVEPRDWNTLYSTLKNMRELVLVMNSYGGKPRVLYEQAEKLFTPQLFNVCTQLEQKIDFAAMKLSGQFCTVRGCYPELDEFLIRQAQIPDHCDRAMLLEHQHVARFGLHFGLPPSTQVVFMPRFGYFLQVKLEASLELDQMPDYQRHFYDMVSNDGFAYFKTAVTRQMAEELGDPTANVDDLMCIVMHDMQELVLTVADEILALSRFCAEVDCLIALAEVSNKYDYCRPRFNEKNTFNVIGARHPLVELFGSTEEFVPNDYVSGINGKLKIITGPNSSGKSVYMKSVCIISFLAQIGSFVPAKEAYLPIVDKILTRIKSVESVKSECSTFVSDVQQMTKCIDDATERSLVAIDEFGKGTQAKSGLALLAGTCIHWLKKPQIAHTIVVTHFHSLYEQLPPRHPQLHFQNFRVEVRANGAEIFADVDRFRYLFTLVDGHAESSMASVVAQKCGLDRAVIERAKEVTQCLKQRVMPPRRMTDRFKAKHDFFVGIGRQFMQLNIRAMSEQEVSHFLEQVVQDGRRRTDDDNASQTSRAETEY